jgi:hypothetical protein
MNKTNKKKPYNMKKVKRLNSLMLLKIIKTIMAILTNNKVMIITARMKHGMRCARLFRLNQTRYTEALLESGQKSDNNYHCKKKTQNTPLFSLDLFTTSYLETNADIAFKSKIGEKYRCCKQ